ncbi:MAG: hypothetical protein HGA44_02580 [Cellulomonadaceae bacterium]|nr:hypothetical protein [Cellulomonadaceae bacterium]
MTPHQEPAPGAPTSTDVARRAWEQVIGQEHPGPWFSVSADCVTAFELASCFEDTDEPEAYPDGLVEGFHLLAMLDRFGRCVPVDAHGHLAWNYGLNRARFITPVHVGERLRLLATVTAVAPKGPDAFLVTIGYTAELEGAARPAFFAEMLAYHERLDTADGHGAAADEPAPAPGPPPTPTPPPAPAPTERLDP